jgi:Domain of unknown function (DUF4340)
MNKHHWVKLLAVTVGVVGLAFWANTSREPTVSEEAGGAPLIAGMKASVNDVKTLRIIGAGDQTLVTLNKTENGWTVAERGGYAADIEKVREYLLRLADATMIEAKTSTEALYSKLGVDDVAKPDAKGMRVEIDGLKSPVKLIVGNYNGQGGAGTFVRRNDEKQSWLAKGTLTPEKSAANWLQNALTDIPSSRIQSVEIDTAGKKLVALKTTPADANYQINDVPKGRELNSAFEGNGMASVLAGLRFEDVKREEPDEITEANAMVKARFQAFDGLALTAHARYFNEKNWVRFAATLDPVLAEANVLREQQQAKTDFEAAKAAYADEMAKAAASKAATDRPATDQNAPVDTPPAPTAPLAISDPAKDKAERLAKLQKEVSELNARFTGWLYVLPAYSYSNLSRKMEDLLKPESPEA